MANEELSIFEVETTDITPPNGQVNGKIALVTSAGAALPASLLPTLPTANGNYVLTVTDGVYTWSAETP